MYSRLWNNLGRGKKKNHIKILINPKYSTANAPRNDASASLLGLSGEKDVVIIDSRNSTSLLVLEEKQFRGVEFVILSRSFVREFFKAH